MITSYKELPLGRYMDIVAAVEKTEDPLQRQVAVVALLGGISEDEVLDLPVAEYKAMLVAGAFIEQPCPERLMKVADTYRLGKYELIPTKDFRKITTAQYVDYLSFIKDTKGVEQNAAQILSVFLIPKGCKYNEGYDIAEVQRAIRDTMSVADALALTAFFLRRYVKSIKASLGFSRRLLQRMKGQRAETLEERLQSLTLLTRSGDGSPM